MVRRGDEVCRRIQAATKFEQNILIIIESGSDDVEA